jgi:hypothetical protein
MEEVETLTEEVANRLIDFSNGVRLRDLDAAREIVDPDFRGTPLPALEGGEVETLPLGITRRVLEDGLADELVGRDAFLASVEETTSRLEVIETVFLKTRGAEFTGEGEDLRGSLRLTWALAGSEPGARPVSIYGWLSGTVRRKDGAWVLSGLVLEKLRVLSRGETLFTEIAAEAGMAHETPALRDQDDPTFYWQGAACADVDEDGRYDVFVSSRDRNFLYRSRGDGTFEDVAADVGLTEHPGATSPLFFDQDNDGDLDLFCAHVGWEQSGVPQGQSLRLYRNDGEGRFRDATAATRIGDHRVAFGSVAADHDNDGFLDVYVSCYERLDAVYPNHWFAATNGTPNALYRNRGDGTYEEVAHEAGVDTRRWSYAAAFADFDEDGDQDLYVANDYGDNELYVNRADGTYADEAGARGVLDTGNGMGIAWGDLDNDGRLDLYVSNMSSSAGNRILKRLMAQGDSDTARVLYKGASGNSLFHQAEDGTFEAVPASHGGLGASWAWGLSLVDLDLDGLLDIYVANGFISGVDLKDT